MLEEETFSKLCELFKRYNLEVPGDIFNEHIVKLIIKISEKQMKMEKDLMEIKRKLQYEETLRLERNERNF